MREALSAQLQSHVSWVVCLDPLSEAEKLTNFLIEEIALEAGKKRAIHLTQEPESNKQIEFSSNEEIYQHSQNIKTFKIHRREYLPSKSLPRNETYKRKYAVRHV